MAIIKRAESMQLIENVIKGLQEKKGSNITVIDLFEIENTITNFLVICEGDSNVHVEAIADSVEEYVRINAAEKPYRIEGKQNAQWIIVDYLDVVVHVFQKSARNFYNLEMLWADATKTDIPNHF